MLHASGACNDAEHWEGMPVQTHHLAGSPMLLCDGCPRGFHMACLEIDYEQLPVGDWACPKCALGEAKAAKREARTANAPMRARER